MRIAKWSKDSFKTIPLTPYPSAISLYRIIDVQRGQLTSVTEIWIQHKEKWQKFSFWVKKTFEMSSNYLDQEYHNTILD